MLCEYGIFQRVDVLFCGCEATHHGRRVRSMLIMRVPKDHRREQIHQQFLKSLVGRIL